MTKLIGFLFTIAKLRKVRQTVFPICRKSVQTAVFVQKNGRFAGQHPIFCKPSFTLKTKSGPCRVRIRQKSLSLHPQPYHVFIVQWIELRFPKPSIRVRFPVKIPTAKHEAASQNFETPLLRPEVPPLISETGRLYGQCKKIPRRVSLEIFYFLWASASRSPNSFTEGRMRSGLWGAASATSRVVSPESTRTPRAPARRAISMSV